MNALPAHDIRQEPDAPLDHLTPAMRACLLDLAKGPMARIEGKVDREPEGYAREGGRIFPVDVIDALAARGLARKSVLFGIPPYRIAYLAPEGVWTIRTILRRSHV